MWLSRLFKRNKQQNEPGAAKQGEDGEAYINRGFYYLYMIVGLQVLLVFGLLGAIMLIGKVIATPGWVFLAMFVLLATSLVYIYRKAKAQLRRFRESFDRAGNNYEISVMGGMLTLRIEQNPNAQKLLEAPSQAPAEPVIDAETITPDADRKTVRLS
jgi:thiosulfate reductase cytochrome b subunit